MFRITFALLFLLTSISAFTQKANFVGQKLHVEHSTLQSNFKDYQVYQIDANAISQHVQTNLNDIQFELQLGSENTWDLQLTPNDMRGEYYNVTTALDKNMNAGQQANIAFRAYNNATPNQFGALTIDENFLYGFVKQQNGEYFIEPLRYFINGAAKNLFVVYASKDVIEKKGNSCGVTEMQNKINEQDSALGNDTPNDIPSGLVVACHEIELAIASDWLMFQDYGSVAGVENHNIGVMNNVGTNYDNEFNHEFQFVIVTQFVSDCSSCDPWTNSTDPGDLLDDFRAWGNAGNFGVSFDIGQCWTDRNFDGGTVGLAWVGGVCNSFKYHVLQDFTNNANFLRVMTAHEIGHNCNYVHDDAGSPWIMAPVVSASTVWSAPSIATIDSYLQGRINNGCLGSCGTSAPPPIAGFSADIQEGCIPLQVQFTDNSGGGAVTTWAWSFPGGIPATSSAQNPLVTYTTTGQFDVILEVTNPGGSDIITETNFISVDDVPTSAFDDLHNELVVTFINLSMNANSYSWDFGDGSSSTEINPIYTYDDDGIYTVTLEAFNDCGVDIYTFDVEVVSIPVALFSSDIVFGCIPATVSFDDLSTPNTTSWNWSFPGGDPSTSTDQFPVVDYFSTGFYDVTLTVTNAAGSDTYTETSYVEVVDLPIPGFTYSVVDGVATFTNTSMGATDYLWNFGDGATSTEINPVHTYSTSGDYIVTLEITNFCGAEVEVQTVSITIETAPVAGFTASPITGCEPLTVSYTDQSSGATSWSWIFPGGNPATSTDQNPVVEYISSGSYDATLTVTNAFGNNTISQTNFIVVDPVTIADFTATVNMDMVSFTNSSIEGTTYAWDFGNGNTSTDTDPSHTYAMDGSYEVELISTNSCGSDTTTQTVNIVTVPIAAFSAPVTSGCADLSVNFSDESTTNATSWIWTFAGGTPATSTDQNPVIVYSTAGTYDVILEVTNSAGSNSSTQSSYITVTDVPVSSFTTSATDMTVVFTNTTVNGTSYTWDFGDGNTSALENPTHTYLADGTYTVTLTATNACGDNVITQTVIISNLPIAGFGAPITSGCADLTVNFTNQSSSNTSSWDWTFPGGIPATSADQNPVVVYNTAGTYNVTLIVSSTAGADTLSQTAYVNVTDVPSAGFTNAVTGTISNFTNTSLDATSYSWDFGDGNNSNSSDPSHDYGADGTYTVVLTATNACGTDMFTQTVLISNLPTAGFGSNVNSGCADLEVSFTDQSSANAESWSWSFPGGTPTTSTAENPTVTYTTAGTYDVSLTVSNAAGEDTEVQSSYIVVTDVPSAGFTSAVTGTISNFTNTSLDATSYSWGFGDGNSSSSSDPSHDYGADGTYTVVLTATNACGTDVFTQTVLISNLPTAGFGSNVNSGCADLEVSFTDQSSANAESWSWSFPGGTPATSTAENPTVTYTTAGTYDVSLTVSNAAGDDTEIQSSYIVVTDVPTAGFSTAANGTIANFTNTSTNATSYSWNFGDGETSGDTNPTHIYAADGTYTVILTATNDCGSVTFIETVLIETEPVAGFMGDMTIGCGPLTVNFTDLSSPNTTAWNWTFDGANPGSSTEQNPTIVFDTPGSYSVTLIASAPGGNSTFTQTSYITVLDTPTAGFTSNVGGTVATFSNNTTNGDTYLWDFGDGNTSTGPNPMNDYLTDGVYTVVLMATNQCGTVTVTETVTIVTPPSAAFSADIVEGCAPLTVSFMDQSSTNASSWNWVFTGGNPATSSEQNPIVVFENPGIFGVSLEVNNSAGSDMNVQAGYIVVNTSPTVAYTSSVMGATATFVNSSVNATSYSWDFGDGNSSTLADPTHTYLDAGTYTVVLTASNECGSLTFTEIVTIVSPPAVSFLADVTTGCAPLTVNFTDQSIGDVLTWDWTFTGGVPAASNLQNPVVQYNTPGVYSVTLLATTSGGAGTFTQTAYISVLDVPSVGFNTSGSGTDYDFANTSTNATSYTWDFGDSNTSTLENPSHTYLADGVYTVSLLATNACGSVTTTEQVTVATAPIAAFTSDFNAGCAPLVVSFQDLSSANTTAWSWAFTGGTPATSNDQNPTVTYSTPGTYPVTLVATNGVGDNTLTQNGFINVTDAAPISSFSTTMLGSTVNFESLSSGATNYTWIFGDGNMSMEENPTHTYTEDGTYDVILTVSNGCGTSEITETIVIATLPTAGFTADVLAGCAPLEVAFTNMSSNNAVTWSWNFDGAFPSTSVDENPIVVYGAAGTYNVSLVATNAQGEDTVIEMSYILVNAGPTADFDFNVNTFDVDFTNTSLAGNMYSWNFGDSNTSVEENPMHTYGAPGIYEVELTVTNDCGTETIIQTVVIDSGVPPIAGFTSDITTGCVPLTVNFEDQSDGADTWVWSFIGGTPETSMEENPTVVYNTPGTYEVSLAVTNAFGSNSIAQVNYVVVEDVPTTGFVLDQMDATVTFTNTSSMANSYSWDFGDGEFSGLENPVHTYTTTGTYEVTLTVTNQCGTNTFTETVEVMLDGFDDPKSVSALNLYPNPNGGLFTLELEGMPIDEVQIRFYNIIGQVIFADTYDFSSGNLIQTFDFSHLAAASYIMQLNMGSDVVYRKVIVE